MDNISDEMPKNIQVPVVSFESNDETSVQFTLVNVDGDFGELQSFANETIRNLLSAYGCEEAMPNDSVVAETIDGTAIELNGLGSYKKEDPSWLPESQQNINLMPQKESDELSTNKDVVTTQEDELLVPSMVTCHVPEMVNSGSSKTKEDKSKIRGVSLKDIKGSLKKDINCKGKRLNLDIHELHNENSRNFSIRTKKKNEFCGVLDICLALEDYAVEDFEKSHEPVQNHSHPNRNTDSKDVLQGRLLEMFSDRSQAEEQRSENSVEKNQFQELQSENRNRIIQIHEIRGGRKRKLRRKESKTAEHSNERTPKSNFNQLTRESSWTVLSTEMSKEHWEHTRKTNQEHSDKLRAKVSEIMKGRVIEERVCEIRKDAAARTRKSVSESKLGQTMKNPLKNAIQENRQILETPGYRLLMQNKKQKEKALEDSRSRQTLLTEDQLKRLREKDKERKRIFRSNMTLEEQNKMKLKNRDRARQYRSFLAINNPEKAEEIKRKDRERKKQQKAFFKPDTEKYKAIKDKQQVRTPRSRDSKKLIIEDEKHKEKVWGNALIRQSLLTEEKLKRRQELDKERKRILRSNMTTEEKDRVRLKNKERARQYRSFLAINNPEKAEEIKRKDRERKKQQKALLRPDTEKCKAIKDEPLVRTPRSRDSKKILIEDEKCKRKVPGNAVIRQPLLSEEKLKRRQELDKERKRILRSNMTTEEKDSVRSKNKERARQYRASLVPENPEKAEEIKRKDRERKQQRRALLKNYIANNIERKKQQSKISAQPRSPERHSTSVDPRERQKNISQNSTIIAFEALISDSLQPDIKQEPAS